MPEQADSGQLVRSPQGLSQSARIAVVFAGLALIAGALLFTEHRAHVLGLLIWLPVLACPLMHFFMHGGHHHHGADRDPHGGDAGSRSS